MYFLRQTPGGRALIDKWYEIRKDSQARGFHDQDGLYKFLSTHKEVRRGGVGWGGVGWRRMRQAACTWTHGHGLLQFAHQCCRALPSGVDASACGTCHVACLGVTGAARLSACLSAMRTLHPHATPSFPLQEVNREKRYTLVLEGKTKLAQLSTSLFQNGYSHCINKLHTVRRSPFPAPSLPPPHKHVGHPVKLCGAQQSRE